MRTRGIIGILMAIGLLTFMTPLAGASEAQEVQDEAAGLTPPRLSFVDGSVSFWRPGAQDWVQAQINTALVPGDQLFAGSPGSLELQIGGRAFVRTWANAQLGLENVEPDFLQFKVTTGRAAFDLRTLEPGHTVEVDTPNAAVTIEHPGYYRVDVAGERTAIIVRRSGRATVTPASGQAVTIAPSEEVVIDGTTSPRITSYAAPPLDDWDKWNYARTDALLDAVSARYVTPGTYGVDDLDHYGNWRVVDPYGSVWVPTGVPAGWAPYSTGSWVRDPFYGWTWVDTAPWGWAPYHHGRWVFVNGFWAWAPGPLLRRPIYAPALVAFLGRPGVHIGVGGPVVSWVALGWGEPCVPWWGRSGFVHRPWWGGWGGPRVVNNVVVQKTTVVKVEHITVYHNTRVQNAVVAVNETRFGRGRIQAAHLRPEEVRNVHPIHAAPRVAAAPEQFVPTERRGVRPPEESLRRPVVATRPSRRREEATAGAERRVGAPGVVVPAPRLVAPPERREPASTVSRPPFGQSAVERPMTDRRPTPPPQRIEERRGERAPEAPPAVTRPAAPEPTAPAPAPSASRRPEVAPPPAGRPEASSAPADREGAKVAPRREEGRRSGRGPARSPEPQASQPLPSPAPPPAGRAEVAPPPAARPEASPADRGGEKAASRREEAGRSGRGPQVRQAAPAPTQPPAARPEASPPRASRPEATRSPARPLPGEPASRLAPNRAEPRPQREADREDSRSRGRGQGKSANDRRERPEK